MARNSWNGIPLLIKLKIEIRELLEKRIFSPSASTLSETSNPYCLLFTNWLLLVKHWSDSIITSYSLNYDQWVEAVFTGWVRHNDWYNAGIALTTSKQRSVNTRGMVSDILHINNISFECVFQGSGVNHSFSIISEMLGVCCDVSVEGIQHQDIMIITLQNLPTY